MLKSDKGITLTSLVIYVIVLLIVIGLMSGFSEYFYKNANKITIKENYEEQYTRFLAYLIKDTNSDQLNFIKIKTVYYLNVSETTPKKILLCNNVTDLTMVYSTNILQVSMTINGRNYEKNINISI